MTDHDKLAALRGEERALADRIACLRRQVLTAARQDARAQVLCRRDELTARAILELTHGDDQAVVCYVHQGRHLSERSIAGVLTALHAGTASSQPQAGVDGPRCACTTSAWRRALGRAQTFLQERSLQEWVRDQNLANGIAPTSGTVLNMGRPAAGMSELTASGGGDMKRKYKLQWLRRWRRRWGTRIGTLPCREWLQKAAKMHKVPPPNGVTGPPKNGSLGRPKTHHGASGVKKGGPFSGTENGGMLICGHHLASESGPAFRPLIFQPGRIVHQFQTTSGPISDTVRGDRGVALEQHSACADSGPETCVADQHG